MVDGTVAGEVWLWRVADRTPLLAVQGHSGPVHCVVLSADRTVWLWDTSSGACLRILRSDRRYERLDITGLTGVTEARRAALLTLGAVDHQAPPG